jgi:hypothetical protein
MSNATYNGLWAGAMAELTEQVHLEDPTLEADAEPHEPVRPTSIAQTFQHLACLYIKYLQIFRRLEQCYDGMVHPQKRLAVLKVLELVMRRVVELKHSLVKYNPPNPAVRRPAGKPEKTFPWEYVNLDDVLVDLKLPPETLDVPVPRYFREDSRDARAIRDKIVAGFMQVRHGVESIALESQTNAEETGALSDLAQCIEMIQRNERGRQGKERAVLVKVVREEEKKKEGLRRGARRSRHGPGRRGHRDRTSFTGPGGAEAGADLEGGGTYFRGHEARNYGGRGSRSPTPGRLHHAEAGPARQQARLLPGFN